MPAPEKNGLKGCSEGHNWVEIHFIDCKFAHFKVVHALYPRK